MWSGRAVLLAQPKLALGALSLLLGLSFLIDGVGMIVAATRSGGRARVRRYRRPQCVAGSGDREPVARIRSLDCQPLCRLSHPGVRGGRRFSAAMTSPTLRSQMLRHSILTHLRLPPHPELAKLRDILSAADEARYPIDRYWR